MHRQLVQSVGGEDGARAGRFGQRLSRGVALLALSRIEPEGRAERAAKVQRKADERDRRGARAEPARQGKRCSGRRLFPGDWPSQRRPRAGERRADYQSPIGFAIGRAGRWLKRPQSSSRMAGNGADGSPGARINSWPAQGAGIRRGLANSSCPTLRCPSPSVPVREERARRGHRPTTRETLQIDAEQKLTAPCCRPTQAPSGRVERLRQDQGRGGAVLLRPAASETKIFNRRPLRTNGRRQFS